MKRSLTGHDIVKRIQLLSGDCQLTLASGLMVTPFTLICRQLGLGSIPTKLAFGFPNVTNIGLEMVVAAISGKSEPKTNLCYVSNSLPLWGPGRLISADAEC